MTFIPVRKQLLKVKGCLLEAVGIPSLPFFCLLGRRKRCVSRRGVVQPATLFTADTWYRENNIRLKPVRIIFIGQPVFVRLIELTPHVRIAVNSLIFGNIP